VCCFVLAFSPIKVKGDGIDVLEEALCRITLDKSYARRSSLAQRELGLSFFISLCQERAIYVDLRGRQGV
jgi:hypothetical protein